MCTATTYTAGLGGGNVTYYGTAATTTTLWPSSYYGTLPYKCPNCGYCPSCGKAEKELKDDYPGKHSE